mgnify:CR=1 FL=1
MSIGENIKNVRNSRGLTQVQLAEKAQISRSYLGDLEGSRYNPSLDTLCAIALALQVDVSDLLGENEIENPGFIIDQELAEIFQKAKDRSDLRVLFSVSADTPREDVEKTLEFIKSLKQSNTDFNHND